MWRDGAGSEDVEDLFTPVDADAAAGSSAGRNAGISLGERKPWWRVRGNIQ